MPSCSAVFKQPVGKCTFDLLVKPSLTGTVSEKDESSMAMFFRDLFYIKSTFDPPINLLTTLNDPVGLVHSVHLLPSNIYIPLLAPGTE